MTQVLLLLVIISRSVTSLLLEPKTECTFKGKIRDHDHCTRYLECDRGLITNGACKIGQYFSPTFSACLSVPQNECVLDLAGLDLANQTCPVNGDKLPGLLSCDTYFHCQNGQYVEEECPSHKSFDAKTHACVDDDFDEACHHHSSTYETQSYISAKASPYEGKCANGTTGLLADPFDCRLYVKCSWIGNTTAQLIIGECAIDKLFDEKTQTCEKAELVSCGERFRNVDIYGGDKSERVRRDPRKSIKPGVPSTYLRPKPGRYVTWNPKPEAKVASNIPGITTTSTQKPAVTAKPNGRKAGRGINIGGKPRTGNVSQIIEESIKSAQVQSDGFPDFSIPNSPDNSVTIRKKRRLKTKVRKTETEFFDEQGNFTNVTKLSKFSNVRPKMRVRLIETETIYDDSDEDKERAFRKNKTPEQVALKIEKNLDRLMDSDQNPNSIPGGPVVDPSEFDESGRGILPIRVRTTATTVTPVIKRKRTRRPRVDNPPIQPMHYMEYEAPPGAEEYFSLNLPQE